MKKLITLSLLAITSTCAFACHYRLQYVVLPYTPHFGSTCSMPVQHRVWVPGQYVPRMKMGVPVMVWVPGHWQVI